MVILSSILLIRPGATIGTIRRRRRGSTNIRSANRLRSGAAVSVDEVERRGGAAFGVARGDVVGVAGQDQKARIRDLLLPSPGLVDRGEPTAVGRNDKGRAPDPWQVGPDVGAGDRLHEPGLR